MSESLLLTPQTGSRGKPEIFATIRKANARKFRGFEAWEKAIGAPVTPFSIAT